VASVAFALSVNRFFIQATVAISKKLKAAHLGLFVVFSS